MNLTQLKAYKVKEVVFSNNVSSKVQLHFNNKVSYNVRYDNNGMCEGTMCVEVFDKKQPDVLNVKVTVCGVFSVKDDAKKELVHVESFKELFPYAKALITTLSANAGIPPIIVQNVDIDSQDIYRFDMNAIKGEQS